jgi:hypothetical protein
MILVTGCARSGTSLTTRILQAHGCWLGANQSVNRLYENIDIRQTLLKPYLRRSGADPRGQKPLPDTDRLEPDPSLRRAVLERLNGAPRPWAYKDAKLTLIWPVWAKAFPEAKWVVVRRDPERIVKSCLHTNFMKAYDNRDGWLGWVAEHERRFEAMKAAGLDLVEVWPAAFIADAEAFRPVAAHCGLAFDAGAVRGAIDPGTTWERAA